MKKNKLLESINNYIQEMHMILKYINVDEKDIGEIKHFGIQKKKKKILLGFEIGLPVNKIIFKNKNTK